MRILAGVDKNVKKEVWGKILKNDILILLRKKVFEKSVKTNTRSTQVIILSQHKQ